MQARAENLPSSGSRICVYKTSKLCPSLRHTYCTQPPTSEAQQQPALNYSLSEPGPAASSRLKKVVTTATHALELWRGKDQVPEVPRQ